MDPFAAGRPQKIQACFCESKPAYYRLQSRRRQERCHANAFRPSFTFNDPTPAMEKFFERLMYCMRWVLAPIYIGMSLALIALTCKFFQEAFHVLPHVFDLSESDLILAVLSMIDMGLVGGLTVMVMFSSYENFVSSLDIAKDTEKLAWLGKLDTGSLKNKVAASIVAISSIHLLRIFMEIQSVSNDKLIWYVVIHLTFVLSALVMAVIDKMHREGHEGL